MQVVDLSMTDIYLARQRIAGLINRSPLVKSLSLTDYLGIPAYLKLESLQDTGSFKIRGVANKLLSLTTDERARGVVTFSTGNHGRAVSFLSKKLEIDAVICISNRVPSHRVDAMKQLGAEVVVYGESQDEAMEHALRLQQERGLTMINPFDDPLIIAGHGTIGLELLEDLPQVHTVLVPLSGGGLIAGVALALKSASPSFRVVGVSVKCAPAMHHSLRAGQPVEIEEKDSIADALLGGIGLDNQYTFPIVQEYVDDIVLVSDEEIADGMTFALAQDHIVAEGAGAVGIAALLHRKLADVRGEVIVVVSGSYVDLSQLLKILQERVGDDAVHHGTLRENQ